MSPGAQFRHLIDDTQQWVISQPRSLERWVRYAGDEDIEIFAAMLLGDAKVIRQTYDGYKHRNLNSPTLDVSLFFRLQTTYLATSLSEEDQQWVAGEFEAEPESGSPFLGFAHTIGSP
jgi:hypothetical protein